MTTTTTDTPRPAAARRLEEVVQNKFADRVPINQAAMAVDDGLVFVEELFVCFSVISIPTMNLFTIPWHVSCLLNTRMICKSDPLVIVAAFEKLERVASTINSNNCNLCQL